MSKEKQIEEMARTLCGEMSNTCQKCDSYDMCEFWIEASVLHNNGYRKQSNRYYVEPGKPPVLIETSEDKQSEGEWEQQLEPYEDEIICSVCRMNFNVIDNCTEKFNYCPNCGAKMRGDTQ